ncbi:hypothetical protein [Streptomyces sp. ME19-01-6]|uniref:hypothetical protein n=1 Tax=Streptomyces sp. ME19-01-6 TaxID=3028686 RepID=UPI0029A1031C|nr:hypothetical protein [Streptomyces sp. ME19-01-6]MDX3232557.1 hypothetical protein [Streptomyces sp. ME19-01-6]
MSTISPKTCLALLRETAAVERLDIERTVRPGDQRRHRAYLVHRAALADRAEPALADVEPTETSQQDAEATARQLLDHDRAHGTSRGPVPAAPWWDDNLRGYAHQEHAVVVRDEHDGEQPHA